MSGWLLVWLVIGLVTTAALLAATIGLIRQLLVVGRALKRFQEEAQPLAEDVAAGGRRASKRGASLGPPGDQG